MIFKNEKLRAEFWKLHPKLRVLLMDIDRWALQYEDAVATCFLRTAEEQMALFTAGQAPAKTSVHVVGRGADLRIFNADTLNRTLAGWVNDKYPYDPKRPSLPTALRHLGTGDHWHIQCAAL